MQGEEIKVISLSEKIISRVFITTALIFTLLPLLSMLSASLEPADSTPLGLSFPKNPQWINFKVALSGGHVLELMKSSSIIVLFVVPITLIFATLASYAIGKMKIKGHTFIFTFFLLGLTIPFESLIVPLYYQVDRLGLLNSRMALVFPLIALFMPFSIFWMRAHFLRMPAEINDAARVDGATELQEFRYIHFPLALPSLSALAVIIFIWTWNQFILGVVLIDDPLKRTVAGALTFFQGQYWISIPLISASALIIITPSLILFLIFQRKFISSLLQGAIKS
jgi:raffinose/stachyose/melibiose transport system permease protein